jgi:small conductance mechanosensitive channel
VVNIGGKVVGAIILWIVGGWAINFVGKVLNRGLTARKVDQTLIRYSQAALQVVLRIALVIAIMSVFGIETTSFAALLAGAGVAIGAAWSGLLANFAAGIFLVVLRPFKVGDAISAAGVTGKVVEIGLFGTTIDTGDNVRVMVGNNKLFSDNIVNYSINAYRRVELKAQLAHGVDPKQAITRMRGEVAKIPNVLATPEPQVEILEFNSLGTLLTVRPYCDNSHYWQVYFDTNKAIQNVCAQAGYPIPASAHISLPAGP